MLFSLTGVSFVGRLGPFNKQPPLPSGLDKTPNIEVILQTGLLVDDDKEDVRELVRDPREFDILHMWMGGWVVGLPSSTTSRD